ncbi:MAG: hypothetical protein GYA24_20835, partial [Candidatus Lokiarchaeota archaeon]|nr:hypothetical protein [Candidatus Lokiarchaeota archaeon]
LGKKNPPFFVPCGKLGRIGSWIVKLFPSLPFQKFIARVYKFDHLLDKVA